MFTVHRLLRVSSRNNVAISSLCQRYLSSDLSAALAKGQVRILYGSQGGTARLFAHDLAAELEELEVSSTIQGLHEFPKGGEPVDILKPGELHIFLVSCAGVGDPPDNAKQFYEYIINHDSPRQNELPYAVFGLGNEKAHPNHYNIVGKNLDCRLHELGGNRIKELGLGDDGDCIEDDFDQWLQEMIQLIANPSSASSETLPLVDEQEEEVERPAEATEVFEPSSVLPEDEPEDRVELKRLACPGIATSSDGTRLVSQKYPTMKLKAAESDIVRPNLFHLQGTSDQFYSDVTRSFKVECNRLLTSDAGESGLHELRVSASNHQDDIEYSTGDHLLVYPRNSEAIVLAYMDILDVDPHAIVEDFKGLTVMEIFSHCLDLGAPPSPAFARMILGRKDVDYKNEIAKLRRTVIDLMHESKRRLSLEDLLFNIQQMKPRYYSIASSSIKSPNEIQLTFRPVKYMTSKGYLREGVCTSFMSHMGAIEGEAACLPVSINHNPTFRLPTNPKTPVLLIAGGCGVAPIRAFIEERIALLDMNEHLSFGPGTLYMGYRNPQDEVYHELVQEAVERGALTDSQTVYSRGCTQPNQRCMLVSELIHLEADKVWNHFESGGHTYLCGGARSFGAAIEAALIEVIQEYGKLDFEQAQDYLRKLLQEGRIAEDLAD